MGSIYYRYDIFVFLLDFKLEKMKCEKESYTKHRAEEIRNHIYKTRHTKKKLRIYKCDVCHLYHLTSNVDDL